MKIENIYSIFISEFDKHKEISAALRSDPRLKTMQGMAEEWGIDLENVERWLASPEYRAQRATALHFISEAPKIIDQIEKTVGQELKGILRMSPSLMRFDGFARYDSGSHVVWFGVDHPDADEDYLRALVAHELSHVFRDHQPRVWAHLGKSLDKVSRDEYLENMTAEEHLVSEGLATLFSQAVFPEVALHVHHYYVPEEMKWCLDNTDAIERAIVKCLQGDQDVWAFYGEDVISQGSPSRTQYFWAAQKIAKWLPRRFPGLSLKDALVEAHKLPAGEFDCFKSLQIKD